MQKIKERTVRGLLVTKLEYHGLHIRAGACRAATALALLRPPPTARRSAPPVVLLAIYRRRNHRTMRALVRQVGAHADIRLWALDEVIPELANVTVGKGPGPKFTVLNRLLATREVPAGAYIAVADDDVVLAGGTVGRMVELMARARVDLAMPAHSPASHFTYPITIGRTATLVTLVGFVEIGPLFVVSAEWAPKVLPFPENAAMGWGLDVEWTELAAAGCRLAILDRYRMFHCVPPARSYEQGPEMERLGAALARRGVTTLDQLMTRDRRWRSWRSEPPWSSERRAGERLGPTP